MYKKNLYNARRSTLPALPQNIEEVHKCLETYPIKTNKNEDFLMVNDHSNKIVIFSCETNIKFLSDLKVIYMDGTFEFSSKFYMQLFTIHGLENDHYVPLVFFLLPNKLRITYREAFKHLSRVAIQFGRKIAPNRVVADFEMAIHKSVSDVWPSAAIVGCRFHLGQAW